MQTHIVQAITRTCIMHTLFTHAVSTVPTVLHISNCIENKMRSIPFWTVSVQYVIENCIHGGDKGESSDCNIVWSIKCLPKEQNIQHNFLWPKLFYTKTLISPTITKKLNSWSHHTQEKQKILLIEKIKLRNRCKLWLKWRETNQCHGWLFITANKERVSFKSI